MLLRYWIQPLYTYIDITLPAPGISVETLMGIGKCLLQTSTIHVSLVNGCNHSSHTNGSSFCVLVLSTTMCLCNFMRHSSRVRVNFIFLYFVCRYTASSRLYTCGPMQVPFMYTVYVGYATCSREDINSFVTTPNHLSCPEDVD